MSPVQESAALTIAAVPNASQLMNDWSGALVQVLASMTDQTPEVTWQAGSAPDELQEVLWWEQPFTIGPAAVAWIGAPRATWEHLGTMTLNAAGVETVETAEAKSTWIEILGQSFSSMARSIGGFLGREVSCGPGAERAAGPDQYEFVSVSINYKDGPLAPVSIGFHPELLAMLLSPPAALPSSAGTAVASFAEAVPEPDAVTEMQQHPVSPTLDLLMDVELPVSISFGKTQLPMKEVLKLTTGSIVELNRGVNESVEVLVNHCLIARGEVVVIDGNYGVRIQHIASRADRLKSVK